MALGSSCGPETVERVGNGLLSLCFGVSLAATLRLSTLIERIRNSSDLSDARPGGREKCGPTRPIDSTVVTILIATRLRCCSMSD